MLAYPSRTAVYGPVRTVVWQGSAGDRRPYADQRPLCLAILRSSPSITAAYRTAVRLHPARPTSPAAPPETPAPHGSAPAVWDRSAGSCAPRATLSPSPRATVPGRFPCLLRGEN